MERFKRSIKHFGTSLQQMKKSTNMSKPSPRSPLRDHGLSRTPWFQVITQLLGQSRKTDQAQYPCGGCNYCRYILQGENIDLPNCAIFAPKRRVTCQSIGVIYLMKCRCRAFYVGKTKHNFFCRIRDHVSAISKLKMETPHMGLYHNHNLKMIGFYALEHIPHTW